MNGQSLAQFTSPESHLSGADPATVGAIIATASDIALIVDGDDRVQDFALGAEGLDPDRFASWFGREVTSIVTVESRPKISELMDAARRGDPPRWRELNHPQDGADDLPVRYCAIRAGDGQVMLLGRDLRPVALLQRRLVGAQQSLERDYARLLQMETRYRLLFQSATEAFLILDSGSQRVLEANAAAAELFGIEADELVRRKFPLGFEPASIKALEAALGAVRGSGRAETVRLRASGEDGREIEAFVSLFRSDGAKLFLVRLTPQTGAQGSAQAEAQIVDLFRRASEAIVLTDLDGRIQWANDSFLDLVQVAVVGQVEGETLDSFFTRQGIDLPLILSNTRETGRLRFYSTSVSGLHGTQSEVEVSSVVLGEGNRAGYGFVLRNAAFRPSETKIGGGQFPHSAQQLTELIGRVPMKDLVRETVDVIERLCIEAALQMTDDNRASAADLLGLSRQSLYVKLRRYGLSEPDSDPAG
ncbi:MAG: transcriptional regulator PpsR [Paracoccaceae bacterium]